ncbi:glutamate-1-semialdehyde 2,1-aminomutase [Sedimentibacter acidaminivorans]|uniref:Glutamate-1-semialdehyde 2,1-aminomutase n=1 Tax=Sedimentibacter acidaminivorans TaxID=913099 RepID=A0ABS4GEP3_9FIRM|nr:glutamate-1-semialdehyde 2,1-aminomutase [Sedimentibacter acidaminivorans]MBP1926167.1 glutamate-1-semialdehyde 2,1-aminomutase [Sedimentibacter acidaminivorans]
MNKSNELFEKAVKVIPGGVNSPVRAFGSVNMNPIFIRNAKGSYIYDVDGKKYIDYISSWGPMIFGHCDEELNKVAINALEKGVSYGVPSDVEVEMAEIITQAYKGCEMVRMVNSGTEATMSAIRVARGYTGKDKIIKFEGCYHGHSDCLLVKSGSGTLTFNVQTSPGVPVDTVKHTLVCEYNNIDSVKETIEKNKGEIACIIIEPVPGNMGVVAPNIEFMRELRKITEDNNIVLIYDEVITGFRLSYGGAAELFDIVPDMVCFGKIIGGGLPVGAYGGKSEIMSMVSPVGKVYQAGTLSGNPLAMSMGIAVLNRLKNNQKLYIELENKAKKLEEGFKSNIELSGVKAVVSRYKSMLSLFFTDREVNGYSDVVTSDTEKYAKYFQSMLKSEILLPPAQYEVMFMNATLSDKDIEYTIKANLKAFMELSKY